MSIFFSKNSNQKFPNLGSRGIARAVLAYIGELLQVIIISLAIIIPIRYFLVQPFYVKGASMEPSFYDKEYLIIDELSYRFNHPERGDIVVFRYPLDPSQYFIKRVIGLPGERVRINGGQVTVFNSQNTDGVSLDESAYLPNAFTAGEKTVTLRADEYYLLGDNRSSSMDSRVFGPVKRKLIVGRVWLRGWPIDRLTNFSSPQYSGLGN